jgi:hypothetical protein
VERHALTSLAAKYGYRSDLTFYTRHGDVFAYLCGIITLGILAAALRARLRRPTAASRARNSKRMAGPPKAHVE